MVMISAVRTALAAAIAAGTSIRTASVVPGQVSPPIAVVRPTRGQFAQYQQSMDPLAESALDLTFDIVVIVSAGSDRAGQAALDGYLSTDQPTSVWAAIQNDPTLGGTVSYAYIDRGTAYGLMEYNGVEYLAATLMCIVGAP